MTLLERIWKKIEVQSDGCWYWTGYRDPSGYGQLWSANGRKRAHRVVYECYKGAIPKGLTLDHLCRVKHCVNPDHLEPVTHQENMSRYSETVTRCSKGHPYNEENTYITTYGSKRCNECRRVQRRVSR